LILLLNKSNLIDPCQTTDAAAGKPNSKLGETRFIELDTPR